jgi:very-short-patch-repair endonuclease
MAALAERQVGMVARGQLLSIGLTRGAIDGRLARGLLHIEYRSVYRVGHRAPLPFSREMGAVLAAGPRAALSHRSAGFLWDLLPAPRDGIDLTGPARAARPGLRMHRTPLEPSEVTRCRGIPVTTTVRTILDLAGGLAAGELERVVAEAERRRLVTLRALALALERHPRRRGAPSLRALLHRGLAPAFTRSQAERRLLALVRAAALPPPDHNVVVAGSERDLVWLEHGLVVETDGYEHHRGRAAFEADSARDAALLAQGLRTLRFTWRQLEDRPHEVVARLAQALAR